MSRSYKKHPTAILTLPSKPLITNSRKSFEILLQPETPKRKSVSFTPLPQPTPFKPSPPLAPNPGNHIISPLTSLEIENDIDKEMLERFKAQFPSERFTIKGTIDEKFYQITPIKEEDSEDMIESKKDHSEPGKSSLKPANSLKKDHSTDPRPPKLEKEYLMEELFGSSEEEEELKGDSSSDSHSSSEEEKENKGKKGTVVVARNAYEKKKVIYNYLQEFLNPTLDQGHDDIHENIEENTLLKKEITAIPQLFRQHTKRLTRRKADYLKVVTMTPLEKIKVDYELFPDKLPCRKARKYTVWLLRY